MKPQAPCKGCKPPERYLGCHDRCQKFQEFRKELKIWQDNIDKIRSDKAYFDDKASKNVGKYKHKR